MAYENETLEESDNVSGNTGCLNHQKSDTVWSKFMPTTAELRSSIVKDFIGVLPQPLKSLYILAFVGLIVNMIAVAFRAVELARVCTGALGVVLLLLGLCAVTNFRGAARGLVEGVKNFHPFGVDYSKSPLASMLFARFFGVMGLIVGAGFIYVGFFAPEFRLR
jgi:hypothetical protein